MKTKLLLVYGYLLPPITSLVFSSLPWLSGLISYEEISAFMIDTPEVLFAFLAIMIAITAPFQYTIFHEENPHVLVVLHETNVRNVFKRATIIQDVIIILLSLVLYLFSIKPNSIALHGFFELFVLFMIAFESIALISNGCSYENIREKILTKVALTSQSKL